VSSSFNLYDEETDQLRAYALDFPESRGQITEGMALPVKGTVPGKPPVHMPA
jgi:hypothetical protein